jgi:hypothetical protein
VTRGAASVTANAGELVWHELTYPVARDSVQAGLRIAVDDRDVARPIRASARSRRAL